MSIILAITTSGNCVSTALLNGRTVLAEKFHNGGSYSKQLVPMIDDMLNALNVEGSDITGIVVDTGPGSFTGIRIGIAVANGMGYALKTPVAGITSLHALKYVKPDSKLIASIIDAHNDNVYAAIYNGDIEVLPPSALTIDELIEQLMPGTVCVGDGADVYRERILMQKTDVRFYSSDENYLKASLFGFAAYDYSMAHGSEDFFKTQAEPTYYKLSQAQLNKKST